jgi:hypothetical protein
MFTGQVAVISNESDWAGPGVIELVDEDDGTTTDLTNPALVLDIEVTIRDLDGCIRATASIANGQVQIPGPGFQYQFSSAANLRSLSPGTWRLVEIVTINGSPTVLCDGTIAIEGNDYGC